jgi:hypothetical protein
VLFDLSRAFDRTWKNGLLWKLADYKIPVCYINWINNFLSGRQARTKVGNSTSKMRNLRDGLPQGSVLSPILFNVFINDLTADLDDSWLSSLFADDLAIAVQADTVEEAERQTQAAVNTVQQWTKKWRMVLAEDKCEALLITTDGRFAARKLDIKIGEKRIKTAKYPKFLGVTFDRLLNFNEHSEDR